MTQKIPVAIGFCNLVGDDLASLVVEDSTAIGALFERVHAAPGHGLSTAPILFLYAQVGEGGTIDGMPGVDLRKVAAETGARIIVLASANPGGGMPKGDPAADANRANLVF